MPPQIRPDCRHYRGLKPCGKAENCQDCPYFEPLGPRLLIVKLGALGDVLRTTPLLRGIKDQMPGAEVIWLTSPTSAEVLQDNPLIDQLWLTGAESLARLQVEAFDRVICLDKEPQATACATLARAKTKQGFGLSPQGRLIVFNQAAVESLRLGLSDELKFRQNQKTYQQLIFETAELEYSPAYDYLFHLPAEDGQWAEEFLGQRTEPETKLIIGFNLGGGDVFANKSWKDHHFLALRRLIQDRWGDRAAVLALGGPQDQQRLKKLAQAPGPEIIDTGANSMTRFAALLSRCQAVVSGDSLGLHLALAVWAWCLVLIGSTTPREIELYGRGEMLVSEMDCAPCYRRTCPRDPDCMELISPETVMARLEAMLEGQGRS